jgi:hypothetical protein
VQDELSKIEDENKASEETVVDRMMFGNPAESEPTEEEPEEVIDDGTN